MSASVTAIPLARFGIGEVVRHRLLDFRGVIFDVDPEFANSDEWYEAIPEGIRPSKDQPFYHLLAENAEQSYVAYVSQQNLVARRQRRADRPSRDRDLVQGLRRRTLSAPARAPPLTSSADDAAIRGAGLDPRTSPRPARKGSGR